eukprot:c12977_g1_i1.p1 GENE.c12977_g1_i1~~c12977_g1_i1.p1  ORF type:complete len:228 (+),score=17.94 c12977_g1_i1:59-685(+)
MQDEFYPVDFVPSSMPIYLFEDQPVTRSVSSREDFHSHQWCPSRLTLESSSQLPPVPHTQPQITQSSPPGAPLQRAMPSPQILFPPLQLDVGGCRTVTSVFADDLWDSWCDLWDGHQDMCLGGDIAHDMRQLEGLAWAHGGLPPSLFHRVSRFQISQPCLVDCSVCLDTVCCGQQCARLGCGHVFHSHCLRDWLKHSRCCPNCRQDLS